MIDAAKLKWRPGPFHKTEGGSTTLVKQEMKLLADLTTDERAKALEWCLKIMAEPWWGTVNEQDIRFQTWPAKVQAMHDWLIAQQDQASSQNVAAV